MFIQKNIARFDIVQALAVSLGYGTTQGNKENINTVYLTNKRSRTIHSSKSSSIYHATYTGIVWCPETEYGTFVARRDGKTFITGNSYPPKLPELCIKASTSQKGCCSICGKQVARVLEKTEGKARENTIWSPGTEYGPSKCSTLDEVPAVTTIGWKETCQCRAERIPCTVLDCFAGTSTTLAVAKKLGRRSIGIELSEKYYQLSIKRLKKTEYQTNLLDLL